MQELNLTLTKNKLPEVWTDVLASVSDFTEIKQQSFDVIASGQNVLATSPTGTGKTLAYLLPSLLKVQKKQGQQLLILAPNS
mgnify:FL=1